MRKAISLDVHLLGQASFAAGGEPIKFAKRATTVSLLAYLILRRGTPVARNVLAFTLFPDAQEEAALAELRRYLYLAQKALPEGTPWILADAETARWNPNAAALIDVREFERLAEDPKQAHEAVAQYGGDLLPEVYDDWAVTERERLRTRYIGLLELLVRRARSDRRYREAIHYAGRLLNEEPWREDVVRHLMSARYESGDGAGALADYDRFSHRAREELRLDPMPETRALRDAIARGAVVPSSLDAPREPATAARYALPFVGRDAQLERVRHAWSRAARGQGGLVLICGEPGIGKSRFAAELALAVEAEGGRVLSGSTSAPERIAYQCIAEVLRNALPLIATLQVDTLRISLLARLVPELADDLDRADAPAVDPDHERARLFEAVSRTMESLSRGRPLLVIVEDLHWAGAGTLELLRTLARRAARLPMLIVGTYRDSDLRVQTPLGRFESDLTSERAAVRVSLGRLSESDVQSALRSLPEIGRSDAPALHAFSEGNPLFLIELIREASSQGVSVASLARTIPPSIDGVVVARLERLSAQTHRIAQVAAIVGQSFDADVVCEICGDARADVLNAVDELLDRHLVRETGSPGGFEYTFTHHLIAQAVYDTVEPHARRRRHARAARSLAARSADPSGIARHYEAAGNTEEASQWFARAAFDAARLFAHEEAVSYASAAIDSGAHEEELVSLLLLREASCGQLGRRNEQLADLARLEGCARGRQRLDVLRRRIDVLRGIDDVAAESAAIANLREEAQRSNEPRWLGLADFALARQCVAIGDYAVAKRQATSALRVLNEHGDAVERIACMTALTDALVATGDVAEAQRVLSVSLGIARESGDAGTTAAVLMQQAAVEMSVQRFADAVAASTEALEHMRTLGDRVGEARALANIATASIRLNRFEAARNANLAAADTFDAIGDPRDAARVLMNLAMLHGRCGDLGVSRDYLRRARDLQVRIGDARGETAALINESFVALYQGQPEDARSLAQMALAHAEQIGHAHYTAQALANLGAAQRDLGNVDEAIDAMQRGIKVQLSLGRMPDAVSDLADLALALAMAGKFDDALARVNAMLDVDSSWRASAIYPPYPLWAAAQVLNATQDSRAARVLDDAAEEVRKFSEAIDAPDLRECFRALSLVQQIAAATEHNVWPVLAKPIC